MESITTLFLWGDRDLAVDPASAEELHRRWNNSSVLIMPRIGHMPYEEAPEEFNRIVLEFLLRDIPAMPVQAEAPKAMAQLAAGPGRA